MLKSWRVLGRWLRLRRRHWRWSQATDAAPETAEPVVRSQLLSSEQLQEYGKSLARDHRVSKRPGPDMLLARLRENAAILDDATAFLTAMARDDVRITPAGEWLLDNYYLIEEQIRIARRHLPKNYSRELPSLISGASAGMPRVYDLAMRAITHSDGRIDADTIARFVAAYQSVTPLVLGELWAIPIMLRLAAIENLRRVSVRVIRDGADHRIACEWADRLNATAADAPQDVVLVVADMARSQPPTSGSFVAELSRRLQGRSATLAMPLQWIEQRLAASGHSREELVHLESQQQAADQVSVSNSIGGLRFLAAMDWRDFVEANSVVEQTLRTDPSGIYAAMDFSTRDAYRHRVETIARRHHISEFDVARIAIEQALVGEVPREITAHVGYYLIDAGLPRTIAAIAAERGHRPPVFLRPRRIPLWVYLLPIALIAGWFTDRLLVELHGESDNWPLLYLAAILGVIVFSELGIALVNWIATLFVTPKPLPRLNYKAGIPAESRTLVVVPTMIGSVAAVDDLIEGLEVRFLANRDPQLHFALLTDLLDADEQTLDTDAAVIEHAVRGIERLNARHAPECGDRFFLLHRPRLWNPRERVWMGYERKRGKLTALNRYLRCGASDDFSHVVGNSARLSSVRYVITLDTDTSLPRDAAHELVATLAHPLNRARFAGDSPRVTRGYTILQPSVGSSMSGKRRSHYARLYGSEPGIDPYTRMVSDVYQDLFGEGSYVGKGIYEVDAFERALDGRLPENRILSHDLLEGSYARAGLISDVRLFEAYPARYAADVKRRQRWIRGDWQLLPWLLPWVPGGQGEFERNPLSWLSRGKLLDNLRRSLVSAAATSLLVIGWLTLHWPLAWTLWLLSLMGVPLIVPAIRDLLYKPVDMDDAAHLRQVGRITARHLERAVVNLMCLPYDAWFSLGAITRTLWRLTISRRRLLQWNPSTEAERDLDRGVSAELRRMWFSPVFAVAVALQLFLMQPASLLVAGPILMMWLVAPLVMHWLGLPAKPRRALLALDQLQFLRRLARRNWAYFETHVTAADNWLPPDNIQEHPTLVVAHRTSPTNIGLSLLANLAAYDFGYLQPLELMQRTGDALATLAKLSRHRGHFYNWYDTQTLRPLPPAYVSTVDSGNLAAHLLTLRQGLLALVDAPVVAPCTLDGLRDTLDVWREEKQAADTLTAACDAAAAAMRAQIDRLRAQPPLSWSAAEQAAQQLTEAARALEDTATDGARAWRSRLLVACEAAHTELRHFAPGLGHLASLRALQTESSDAQVRARASQRIEELERLAHLAGQYAQMEYGFLYDRARHLLSIGYNVDEHRLDPGYYDLLASEARLASFVAIAQGQLPQESWFALSRLLTEVDGDATLLSWSGSMFEYLMPQLVMPSYPDTLLEQTAEHAVKAQINYGAKRDVPWGISESGYNMVDARMNYQYRAFGVPGLGIKRGLGDDLVVAPYASMLALMVEPAAACRNLERLTELGFAGRFGLYEAIDYSTARVPPGQDYAVVRSYMTHHQSMGLLALLYLLRDQPMQKRFTADAEFQATLLLLQERIPRTGVFRPREAELSDAHVPAQAAEMQLRVFRDPDDVRPIVQLLSNGRYHAMLSNAGGGYSRLGEMALYRWREDGTRDQWGNFCYLRDVASGEFWSAAHQPACVPVEQYEAIFSDAKAEYRGRKLGYDTHLEIAISAEDEIELRRLHIRNRSASRRTIEVTTYAEVVLAPAVADEMHPAFSNLFVQTEIVRDKQALLAVRRPRAHDDTTPMLFHLVAVHDADLSEISYETDRSRFLGRGNTPRAPRALTTDAALSDSAGSVLDPIVAIRLRIVLAPQQTAQIDMVFGVAHERYVCATLIDKYRDRRMADRVFDLAWTHSQVVRRQINASQADARLYERLAGFVLFSHPFLRADATILMQNRRGQSGLWGHSISGDLPIVLVQISDAANIDFVRQMVKAHAYWRLKGLNVDLVIWNEEQAGYRQVLQEEIVAMASAAPDANLPDRRGAIFVRPAHQISHEDRILLRSVARIILNDQHGSLEAQIDWHAPAERTLPSLIPARQTVTDSGPGLPPAAQPLLENGIGNFSSDGREYVITLRAGESTPAPWANVLANPSLGTVVSESAPGYTWFENAHEFRLTPWHNDPVSDTGGEAFYLRDEETGHIWSPMPLPRRSSGTYRTTHGFGYSVYEHVEAGIKSELWVYVALEDAVKFSVLKLYNTSGRARRLTATGYVEWVLGDLPAKSRPHIITDLDESTAVLTARNPYSTEFSGRVAFFDVDAQARSFTTDRAEFLGRNGSLTAPAALTREHLSGTTGAGLDPCAAIQIPITLAPEQRFETTFRLGAGRSYEATIALARSVAGSAAAQTALDRVRAHWRETLTVVQVRTPDPSVDVLANGWLLYQVLACRYLARSGYYQSGGAFGFRDQLQDTMASVHARPALTRTHLLLSAAHQFPQGDVLHWWHPPSGRGVRTRCSDDYLWLPLAACRYLQVTGDQTVLDEPVRFIEGRLLNSDEESYFDQPTSSALERNFYQHCVLAIKRGTELLGARGLPLIGSGDWNDGMNRVGHAGSGESVWLGFFLFDVLVRFAPVAAARGDQEFADFCEASAQRLRASLEQHAWDGEWYQRAWFDDGSPLGSAANAECRIDSISQSWAVLSAAADPARALQAMNSLDRHLVKRAAGLIQLLDPPFDRSDIDPGYIRGYVPGVRENGGQYTHAAVWAAMAFAQLGDQERAWELARLINPIQHTSNAAATAIYKAEPYVLAADVYAVPPHVGRGGWSWYTGSAGWMYRLFIESLLGLQRQGDELSIRPCVPLDWPGYQLEYRYGKSTYRIEVTLGADGSPSLVLDGATQPTTTLRLVDDGADHRVELSWPRTTH